MLGCSAPWSVKFAHSPLTGRTSPALCWVCPRGWWILPRTGKGLSPAVRWNFARGVANTRADDHLRWPRTPACLRLHNWLSHMGPALQPAGGIYVSCCCSMPANHCSPPSTEEMGAHRILRTAPTLPPWWWSYATYPSWCPSGLPASARSLWMPEPSGCPSGAWASASFPTMPDQSWWSLGNLGQGKISVDAIEPDQPDAAQQGTARSLGHATAWAAMTWHSAAASPSRALCSICPELGWHTSWSSPGASCCQICPWGKTAQVEMWGSHQLPHRLSSPAC